MKNLPNIIAVTATTILLLLAQSLAIALLWYFLIVPMGARALLLREAFAVGMFINYFIMQKNLEERSKDRKLQYRISIIAIGTVVYLALSYIYAMVLL
jgi:multisubunit Na+/H+ antiporter MnhB subunit